MLNKDREALRQSAEELAQGQIAARAMEVDRSEQYPWDNVGDLKDGGFFGMTIPTEYGGRGLDYLDAALVVEEMAKVCGVSGRIAVEANMGAISAIMAYGTDEQKRLAADLVLSVDKPAICIKYLGFLKNFKNEGMRVLGIEPAQEIVKEAIKNGVDTIPAYFNIDFAEEIMQNYGYAGIITVNNRRAHK